MTAHPNRYLDPLPPPGSVYRLTVNHFFFLESTPFQGQWRKESKWRGNK
jgi:hypothetical protein